MATIIQISDPHLSRNRPFFLGNWQRLVTELQHAPPDGIVVSGDLSVNGAEEEDELAAAAIEIDRLPSPLVRSIAGNHDIGDEPPGTAAQQTIDDHRRARFRRYFGPEWWLIEIGRWSLIGINSMLCGSGLNAERQQLDWLEAELIRSGGRPTGLFLHKPLFIERPDEPDSPGITVSSKVRSGILDLIRHAPVRFVASGHLHQYRARRDRDTMFVWAPSTAFLTDHIFPGAERSLGYVVHRLHDDGVHAHEMVRSPVLSPHDLAAIKGHGRFRYLKDMPPDAVAEAMERLDSGW